MDTKSEEDGVCIINRYRQENNNLFIAENIQVINIDEETQQPTQEAMKDQNEADGTPIPQHK